MNLRNIVPALLVAILLMGAMGAQTARADDIGQGITDVCDLLSQLLANLNTELGI